MKFKHLDEVNQKYFEHFKDALYYSMLSLKASICFLIHSIYPDIFIKTGSTSIFNLNEILLKKMKQKDI